MPDAPCATDECRAAQGIPGKAAVVLTYSQGAECTALLTSLQAECLPAAIPERLQFEESAGFDSGARAHLLHTVLPIVDTVLAGLGIGPSSYRIALTNPELTSILDRRMAVSGFSADLAVFLALLSATLDVPMRPGLVATGHLASPQGDIRMVRDMAAKTKAILEDGSAALFLHPPFDAGSALASLAPNALQATYEGLLQVRRMLRTRVVAHLGELVPAAFDGYAMLRASLAHDFLDWTPTTPPATPIAQAIECIGAHNRERYWTFLSEAFVQGNRGRVTELLGWWLDRHRHREEYPIGLGKKLEDLLYRTPAYLRRTVFREPLFSSAALYPLRNYLGEQDLEDYYRLLHHLYGGARRGDGAPLSATADPPPAPAMEERVRRLLQDIAPQALVRRIGGPINDARASFGCDSTQAPSARAFEETVAAFYLHLMRHLGRITGDAEANDGLPDAVALLDRAVRGGYEAALENALSGRQAGLRGVLDAMAERCALEEQNNQVEAVLAECIDTLPLSERAGFTGAFLRVTGLDTQAACPSEATERLAGDPRSLVTLYLSSLQPFRTVVRSQ